MKIQVELKGFTPLLDTLVKEFGIVTASVYGIVWRYAQMEDKVCRASLERIADRIDISSKTAERHIKKLCASGYLEDLTTSIKNKPHIYIVTGKAELAGVVSSEIRSDRESDLGQSGQTESLTRSDRESDLGKTESLLKIHNKKDNKDILENSQNPKTELNTLASKIAIITKTDIDTVGPKTRETLKQLTIALSKKPNIEIKLPAYEKWWYSNDWRGKQGQLPTVWHIGDTWGQFEADKVAPPPSSGPALTEAEKARLAELTAQFSQPK